MEQKTKAVIVDSNEAFRIRISDFLRDEGGFEIVGSTGEGAGAMELVRESLPDIVLTDLILLDVDGFTLLESISELPAEIRPKMIVVSNFTGNHMVTAAKNLGAVDFIQKSCDPRFLLFRIKTLLNTCNASGRLEEGEPFKTLCKSSSTERIVTELMHGIGIPAHIKGYQYLREAIMRAVDNMDIINAVTKELYPDVAKRFHTTASRVERAIRHAIEVAWNRGGLDVWEKHFGYTISNIRGKPTNSEFIALMADTISLDRRAD